MRKIIICICLPLCMVTNSTNAQSGFRAGAYYQTQYQVNDRPIGVAQRMFDYYGNYIGTYQVWQRAVWHSTYGGQYVYVWAGNSWQSQRYSGYYYWYEWVNYQRFLGY